MRSAFAKWWLAIGFAAAWVCTASAAAAPTFYHIDQRYGTINFSITSLGLFTTEGRFARFSGELLLDPEQPERTHVDVTIDGNSVKMPIEDEVSMLRSPSYFDTARYPTARFVSTSIQALSPTHYLIHGTLQIRGVANPQVLDAVMTERQVDTARHVQWADFVITGQMRRSAFGMVADRAMVSDAIDLKIRIRLTVGADPKTG